MQLQNGQNGKVPVRPDEAAQRVSWNRTTLLHVPLLLAVIGYAILIPWKIVWGSGHPFVTWPVVIVIPGVYPFAAAQAWFWIRRVRKGRSPSRESDR